MKEEDSFFGFETRLPRDMERPVVRQSTETSRDPFTGINMDAFADLRLDEIDRRNTGRRNEGILQDPWMQAAAELDSIDTREIFSDIRNSRSSSNYNLGDLTGRNSHMEPRSSDSTSWQNAGSPNFFTDKEDVDEQRFSVDLSRLMDDTDSFNSAQTNQEFFNEFTKQTYHPYTPRDEPMSLESSSKETSTWGSTAGPFSSFGGTWSGSESPSAQTATRKLSTDRQAESLAEQTLGSGNNRQVPNVVRTPMTLEELESQFVSPSTPRNDSPKTGIEEGVRSPFHQPNLQGFPPVNSPLSQSLSGRPDLHSQFGLMDPNIRPRGGQPRHGFVPIPGRMPHPGGSPGFGGPPAQMRFPYPGLPPRNGERGSNPGQFMPIRGFTVMPGMRVPLPLQPQFVHPQFVQGGFRGPRPFFGPVRMYPGPPNRHMMSQVFHNQRYAPDVDHEDDEEVTGWMTEREKDWVIKVQQSQIRTDNPYMDDYYYYVRGLKKSAKDSKGGDDLTEQDFIVPARMASEPKEERINAHHFEGSLGKVCISSVFNPRKTVDVDAINMSKNRPPPSNQKRRWFVDPLQKEKGHPKSLLLGIEEIYKLILELHDISREIQALPASQREQGMETQRNIINLIFDKLIQGTTPELRVRSFCDTVKIRKGRELLRRVLPVLFKEQLVILTGYCVRALPVLTDIPNDKLEGFSRCLVSVEESLNCVSFKRLVEMLSPLVDTQHNLGNTAYTGQTLLMQAVKNQFSMHFLGIFVARAEASYDADWESLSEDDKEKWTLFVTYFFIALTKANSADVAALANDAMKSAVSAHMGRFPFSPDAVEGCRAKLHF